MGKKREYKFITPDMKAFAKDEVRKMVLIWPKRLKEVCINDYTKNYV